MNDASFNSLSNRSLADALTDEAVPLIKTFPIGCKERSTRETKQMTEDGEALILSDEEIAVVRSFRRFKTMMRKDGEVFKWQTRRESGVVLAEETALIYQPQEVS